MFYVNLHCFSYDDYDTIIVKKNQKDDINDDNDDEYEDRKKPAVCFMLTSSAHILYIPTGTNTRQSP